MCRVCMNIAYWSKVSEGCCDLRSAVCQYNFLYGVWGHWFSSIQIKQTKKNQFKRRLSCLPLGCATLMIWVLVQLEEWGQGTIAPSTEACLYFSCIPWSPGSLAACADLNPGICLCPTGRPACLGWNLYFCHSAASLLRELMWLNTNCSCIWVVHQAV